MYSIPFIPKPRTSTVWKDSSNNTKGTRACYQQPEKKRYYQHSRSPHFCILPKDNYCCDLTINGLNLRFVHVASSCSSIVWINLNLVFHPVDVHFDSFLFGLIMNRGTVKIVVHDFVRAFLLSICLGLELLGIAKVTEPVDFEQCMGLRVALHLCQQSIFILENLGISAIALQFLKI